MRFSSDDLAHLDSLGLFSDDFLSHLDGLRFTGEVVAVPEGRLFFKNEPVLEITAPIIEGQLAETAVINLVNLQSNIAIKVSRCVHTARGRNIVDFSLRRTHGTDAGMAVARAGYIAGLSATSNVLVSKLYGIPVSGTMAHSFVTSFDDEIDAFRSFAEIFGNRTVLLIDTYDTLAGAENAVKVTREMAQRGQRLRGVRLDSGDMVGWSRQVRNLLYGEGLQEVKIFATGGFDEYKIDRSIRDGAQIDAFGSGTKMGVSADCPYTDMAYKLVQFDGRPVMKLSSGKKTLVAPKQVFRRTEDGLYTGDTIALRREELEGEPLLRTFMRGGKRTGAPEALNAVRSRFKEEFGKLPEAYKSIEDPPVFPVDVSERLRNLQKRVKQNIIERELCES